MKCHICQKEIIKRIDPSKIRRNKHHFCSRKCYVIFWGQERKGKKNAKWNPSNERICKICSKTFRRANRRGIVPKYCSMKCKAIDLKIWFSGKNNPRWKGGISDINSQIRHSEAYIAWRNACGTRDKITCQFCGKHKQLVVHHIKTFEKYPELRFEVSNGITLCRGCHIKMHREHKGVHDFTNILNDYMPNMSKKL